MAMISALLIVLSVVMTSVVGDPTGAITCTETGFEPTFTKTFAANTYWTVVIGDVDLPACRSGEVGPLVDATNDATLSIDKSNINGDVELTYKNCGGTLVNEPTANPTQIDFKVGAAITVRLQGTLISRETYYGVALKCSLTKLVATPTSASKWIVDIASADITTNPAATGTFGFDVEINYYTEDWAVKQDHSTWNGPVMGGWMWVRVEEATSNALFHFVVQDCWFTTSSTTTKDNTADQFFEDGCMVDKSAANNDQQTPAKAKTDTDYDFKVKAFFFTGEGSDGEVFLHCQLYICMETDTDDDTNCVQINRNTCAMTARKRRAIGEETVTDEFKNIDFLNDGHGPVETRIVTAKKALLLPNSEVIVPSCGAHFIYDRVSKSCSNQNLLDIKGVYLDIPWNPEYADTSSKAWKDFKIGKEYQLWALMMMYDEGRQIRGLEVLSATKGSVILTLRITYDVTATASSAQRVFEEAYQRASETRVQHVLNIRQDKVIEYVQVRPTSSGINIENMTLIIIVVVLCAVVFVSVVAAWKVRSNRRAPSSGDPKAHDNPTYNMS